MTFSTLGLHPTILAALDREGYEHPTPIQRESIPQILAGRDLLGIAQTGTGKTAAFSLPMLQILAQGVEKTSTRGKPRPIRSLILTPTRELAIQIDESIARYGHGLGLRHAVIFGGVNQSRQVNTLAAGVDILVATPGRLIDLMGQGYIHLEGVEFFVLDEADRMLDMGFVHDVRRVLAKLPRDRQSLFFSATMPCEITDLASTILRDPVRVEVTPPARTADMITQSVYFVSTSDKKSLLKHLLRDETIDRVLVFTRTKHGANKVEKDLNLSGITAAAIHGNKSQNARQNALSGFKEGSTRVLVATDIAARGIDIDDLTHVINYELPNVPESYVHRIGRTGRAGASGVAIAFCDHDEREYLRDIERLIRSSITVVSDPDFVALSESSSPKIGEAGRGVGVLFPQKKPKRSTIKKSLPLNPPAMTDMSASGVQWKKSDHSPIPEKGIGKNLTPLPRVEGDRKPRKPKKSTTGGQYDRMTGEKRDFSGKKNFGEKRDFNERNSSFGEKKPWEKKETSRDFSEKLEYSGEKREYPKRDFNESKPSFGGRKEWTEKKPAFGERKTFGEKKSWDDRGSSRDFGEKKNVGEKRDFGASRDYPKKDFSEKREYSEDRAGVEKPFGQKRAFSGAKKSFGASRDFGGKQTFGEKKPWEKKETSRDFSEKREYSGEKREYPKRDFNESKPSFGGRKEWTEKKPAFGERKTFGEKKSWEDRGSSRDSGTSRDFGEKREYPKRDFNDKKPWEKKPSFGEKKSFGDTKPWEKSGEKRDFGSSRDYPKKDFSEKREYSGERREYSSEKKPWEKKPEGSRTYTGGKRDFSAKKSYR